MGAMNYYFNFCCQKWFQGFSFCYTFPRLFSAVTALHFVRSLISFCLSFILSFCIPFFSSLPSVYEFHCPLFLSIFANLEAHWKTEKLNKEWGHVVASAWVLDKNGPTRAWTADLTVISRTLWPTELWDRVDTLRWGCSKTTRLCTAVFHHIAKIEL